MDRTRLPAEWEPHRATWLAWPHNEETWPGVFDRIPDVYARIVRTLRRFEEVRVLVREASDVARLSVDLGEGCPVTFVEVPTNDAWVRDYGPIFTRRGDGSLGSTVWRFNSWGGKYPPWDLDAAAGRKIAAWTGSDLEDVDVVLEGGSIDVNGRGALLTTSCPLDPRRNPTLDPDGLEAMFGRHFGVTRVIWLHGGIEGDDTDGHVDNLARFVDERTVVATVDDDPRSEHYGALRDNVERLRKTRDQDGRPLRVVELPTPEPVVIGSARMPASYANFYIANRVVVAPTYGCSRDDAALDTLQELFRGREVVGIDCRDLVRGLGAIHCITQQEPISTGPARVR